MTEEEARTLGKVPAATYLEYIKGLGGVAYAVGLGIMYTLSLVRGARGYCSTGCPCVAREMCGSRVQLLWISARESRFVWWVGVGFFFLVLFLLFVLAGDHGGE